MGEKNHHISVKKRPLTQEEGERDGGGITLMSLGKEEGGRRVPFVPCYLNARRKKKGDL